MNSNEYVYRMIGASNHSISEREINDYYATPPRATKELLKLEKFYDNILEPYCGEGGIFLKY